MDRKTLNNSINSGFTLVEVVIVLVVLGILGSIAIPRFIDLQRQSRLVALQSIEGTLYSTTGIYRSYAGIQGVETGNIQVNGTSVKVHSGYPEGLWNGTFRYILDISAKSSYTSANARCANYPLCGVGNRSSIYSVAGTSGGRGVIIWPDGFRIRDKCFAYYYNPHNGNEPMIGVVDSGC